MKSTCRLLLAATSLLASAFVTSSQAQSLPSVSLLADLRPVRLGFGSNELVQHSDGWVYGTSAGGGAYDYGMIFRLDSGGTMQPLVHFTGNGGRNRGAQPLGRLTLGPDGCFYGSTFAGGSSGFGTVFKMTLGGVLTTLVDFTGTSVGSQGSGPLGGLTLGDDGNFYGVTQANYGTVFRMTPGGNLTTLLQFGLDAGFFPAGPLIRGADGNLYGMTKYAGPNFRGTMFKMTLTGTFTTLVAFGGGTSVYTPSTPSDSVTQGTDGSFYGMTERGGAWDYGTVFKISPNGELTTLVEFNGFAASNRGRTPFGGLTLGENGSFYGMTSQGGTTDHGTLFKVNSAGVLTTLVEFTEKGAFAHPRGSLMLGSDGSFFGMTAGTVFKVTPAGVITTLLQGNETERSKPTGSLSLGPDGNLYGMTLQGASYDSKGTAFKVTPAGVVTTLLDFSDPSAANNVFFPNGSLTLGADGHFYGTTRLGGSKGHGTVFKMTPAGGFTTLVDFGHDGVEGAEPMGSLTVGVDGCFYGTTFSPGTVFKMTPAGVLTTLAVFTVTSGAIGHYPVGGLALAPDGCFYGMTSEGGASNDGTVFKITAAGVLTTLVEFTGTSGSNLGRNPMGNLSLGADGCFYGLTSHGGVGNFGTAFKMTPAGELTTLVEFTDNGTSNKGAFPQSGLTLGADGRFYGITARGGIAGSGTLFQMTSTGNLSTLVEFGTSNTGVASGVAAGFAARAGSGGSGDPPFRNGLTKGADGDLYGVTGNGGQGGGGIVFKVDFADSFTAPPTLILPATDFASKSPVAVSFIFPEAALPGTVKLAFGGTELTLAASEESLGAHRFTFDPADPTASPEIAVGSPIPDGTYTVTLSYQDAEGNAAASSVPATNVVIDTSRPVLNFPFSTFSQREDRVIVKVPVTLDRSFGTAFNVPFSVGGSAAAEDATVSTAPLKFAANQTTAFISIGLKDDLLVEGDDTLTLTLGVPAMTGVGVVSPSVFTLTIVEDDAMPVIAPNLGGPIVAVGDAVTFASGVTGSAPLTLKWKKGSATLLGETGTSLVLPPVTLSSAGTYSFSASNQRGSDSSTAELAVVDRSDTVVRSNAGTSPKLIVAVKGKGLSYRWHDVDGPISTDDPKYAGVTTATLTVKNVVAADTGHYVCLIDAVGRRLDTGDRFLQVPSLKPIANTPALPDVVIHNAFSHQLTFDPDPTRAPTRFLCSGLPKGLRCDPATGLISGKPTETGDFTVTVTLSNAADTADSVQDTFSVLAYPAGAVGKYVGVIGRNTKANGDLGGRIDFTTTPLGSYTGAVKLGSSTLKLSGTLTTPPTMGGHPGVTLSLARSRKLPVILSLDLDPATNELTGSVYEQGETGSDNLMGWRNTWTSAAPTQQGAHSFKIDPAATGPQGYGFGSIAVSATGVTTLKGQTADGGVATSSGLLGPDGEVLVFAPMLGNKASLLGTLGIGVDHSINSSLSWQKTAATKSREYAPFGPLTVTVTGGLYLTENPVLGLTDTGVDNAQFLFSEAGVPSSTNPNVAVYINNANKVTLNATNPGNVKLTSFNASTGAFTGQFTLKDAPAAPRTVKFQGQLVPTDSRGYGYFLLPQLANPPTTTASTSPILSGRVVLE